ncbi:Sec-independent protein translocase subunit TatA [Microbacterium aoyamense]|uniref:Sec-independent protein translocase protein TatA n=1 Tax=Microbacterium aoyamense TaxID=344166 RepID=A0ABN2PIA3_9MICO|nr:twin-arginine translocase TatA/TatE family subunit [Microbacterium aoyamense]
MLANLTGWHALLILAVILLLFGAAKLPALARSVGQSARVLKTEIRSGDTETAQPAAPGALANVQAPVDSATASRSTT